MSASAAIHAASAFAVAIGAALGALLRWLLGLAFNPLLPSLPLGTLAANLVGGLLMGVAMALFAHYETVPLAWRLAATTGFLGGLTTFSAFSGETVQLLERQQWSWAAAMVSAHLGGSLLMTIAGLAATRALLRAG
ncbi:MAG: fluoride efflux transporter CrcB [Rhodanobacter denitrificans]|uniref:Fluoride-specific ion channel FluC n=1 Tax=Rhodanobacter denitrificans TaxID=666685 RepID=A0A2W5K3R7_9GAMM|nr:MAG: fluoride efflux transporter CrcB [Rhodanobacter denitrificans]